MSTRSSALSAAGRREDAIRLLFGRLVHEAGLRMCEVCREWIEHNEVLAAKAGRTTLSAVKRLPAEPAHRAQASPWRSPASWGSSPSAESCIPIRALRTSVESIAAGDYLHAVPFTQATDETGALARSIDVLKRGAAAMEDQRWVKANIARLARALQGATSHSEFGQRLLSGLVPMLGGGVAAFYLLDKNGARSGVSRATDSQKKRRRRIGCGLGEGLAGQCARERVPTVLTNLPPDYLRISSGLGRRRTDPGCRVAADVPRQTAGRDRIRVVPPTRRERNSADGGAAAVWSL